MELIKIEGLSPQEYEHPFDKKALNALEKTPGLDLLVRKFYELSTEKLMRLEFTGSNLKITPSSFPDVYEILEDACENLNLKTTPEFYLRYDDYFRTLGFTTNNLQGITVGVTNPLVAISVECIERFSRPELLFIIGCEIGRIKSQHVLYEDIARLIPVLSGAITAATFGFAGFSVSIMSGLDLALTQWLRMADYTADRAGLLACQDVNAAMMAMAKIAGLPKKYFNSFNIDDFITQAREFEGFADNLHNKFLKGISLMYRDQAFTIARANELLKWIDSGSYQSVLERKTRIQAPQAPKFCRHCGSELQPSNLFCPSCGNKVMPV
ncbi:zinc-ribbon domain-containing protein [Oscillatoria sp. FACHB-1407]|uniref:M48 family metallopeptidase n=1 Tax=Oscillatoria sp. FACHB-1407 TaxID=2692847 RepID=UPI0016837620|nr:M48 family metallopeptidase [Oscillatoria sp. FACHB-1407]MBD2462587.1 zinc-ribbon domain-containing protein [Oscillatoria sp. FACHB-1407]